MTRAGVIVLAAGAASRFGGPKQVLLLPRVLARLEGRRPLVVVAGAHPLGPLADPTIVLVEASDWQLGPGASLRAGLSALPACDVAVVVLADGPNLAPAAIDRVLEAWRATGGIVAASYRGVRGHPVAIGREHWNSLPDDGGRSLPVRLVPCDDLGFPGDVDTPEDLQALQPGADN